MLVWIVNPFDNLPAEGFRPQRYWLMSRGFAAAGHETVYWTSDFSHASKRLREMDPEYGEPGISLRFVHTVPYVKNVGFKRLYSHWKLAGNWLRLAEAERSRPDVVIASTPPLCLCRAAQDYAKRAGALFVADVMDAWPETFERVAPKPLLAPLKRIARRIYTRSDAVSAVAGRYIRLAESYGCRAPAKLFYHGIDIGEVLKRRERTRPASGGPVKLVYAGTMGASYDLETVIDAASRMSGVTLDIAGSGPKEPALRQRAGDCSRIRFHGYLKDRELKELLSQCDIGIIPMFPESCVGVPYKLADYAAAGLKVVECLGGETSALTGRFGAGAHYTPRDARSFTAAVEALAGSPAEFDFASFASQFDAKSIMSAYVAWVEPLASLHRKNLKHT